MKGVKNILGLLLILTFTSCNMPGEDLPNYSYIEFFDCNGWTQVKAFRIDSLRELQVLMINNKGDSNNTCYKLSESQYNYSKIYVDSILKHEFYKHSSGYNCADCRITKIIIKQEGQKFTRNSSDYEFPTAFDSLVKFVENIEQTNQSRTCYKALNINELEIGYKGIFKKPDF